MRFVEQIVELASGPLRFQVGGEGPPLLHLHSAAGPRQSPVIERLALKHTIYAPTTPGFDSTPIHGSVSDMPSLGDLMAEFVAKRIGSSCDVMAESFGGWIALWMAANHPDRVAQLVLEAPAGMRDKGTGGLPPDPAERDRKLYAVPERAPRDPRPETALAENMKAVQRYTAGETLDRALLAALPQIKARTLILFGTRDEVVPIAAARRLKSGIRRSHLSYVYGAAHALEFDQPERVARLVGSFLERGEAFMVRSPEIA